MPSYAISDEDILEFICVLQSENFCPEKLFSELENNNLLLLGCGFSDWLERFFLRMAKRHRLSDPRSFVEVVADSRTPGDPNLVLFLQQVSSRTKIFRPGDVSKPLVEKVGDLEAVNLDQLSALLQRRFDAAVADKFDGAVHQGPEWDGEKRLARAMVCWSRHTQG